MKKSLNPLYMACEANGEKSNNAADAMMKGRVEKLLMMWPAGDSSSCQLVTPVSSQHMTSHHFRE